jgi:hypothetical protein
MNEDVDDSYYDAYDVDVGDNYDYDDDDDYNSND